jgi:hypothetical protein
MIGIKRNHIRACAVGLALVLGGEVAAAAAGPGLRALSRVERGQWQLKEIGVNPEPRTICVRDPRTLVHYGHDVAQCQHTVTVNDINTTTVHYACQGSHGQTTVKVATPRSFNLDTQGIINGAPFEDSFEARYLGACPAGNKTR